MSRSGSTDPGRFLVCCSLCYHLRFQRFPRLSHATSRRAGCMCRCSVPCAVRMSSGLPSDVHPSFRVMQMTPSSVWEQRRRRWLPPCSSTPVLIPAAWHSPKVRTLEPLQKDRLASQCGKAQGIPGCFQANRMADVVRMAVVWHTFGTAGDGPYGLHSRGPHASP